MATKLLFLLNIFWCFFTSGQTIRRSVINSCGTVYGSSLIFSVGEPLVGVESHNGYFCKGFIQPIEFRRLTDIEYIENSYSSCSISPVPASDKISLSFDNNVHAMIFTIYGGEVTTIVYESNNEIDISNLKAGVYFIRYAFRSKIYICKFIKS
jgi:hypothetical protein